MKATKHLTSTLKRARRTAELRNIGLTLDGDGAVLTAPFGYRFRKDGETRRQFRVDYDPEDGPRETFYNDLLGVVRRVRLVFGSEARVWTSHVETVASFDGDPIDRGWYYYLSDTRDEMPTRIYGPFPTLNLARLAAKWRALNVQRRGDTRRFVLNCEGFGDDARSALAWDVRSLRCEMERETVTDAVLDRYPALAPTTADAERELLRRIGGQENLGSYVAAMIHTWRRETNRAVARSR